MYISFSCFVGITGLHWVRVGRPVVYVVVVYRYARRGYFYDSDFSLICPSICNVDQALGDVNRHCGSYLNILTFDRFLHFDDE